MPLTDAHLSRLARDKGKQKQVLDEQGNGGSAGIVLPLQMVSSSSYQAQYTVSLLVGSSQQNLSLQVDTGSSDLWIASTACYTPSCGQAAGHLYNPSTSSVATQKQFSIQYAAGQVTGPIVWDSVALGGYNISSQALAAASSVTNEPLAPQFDGILGLALPLDSIISEEIPPTYGSSPDGAVFASNLFSLTPTSDAPAARFLSIALERPGSDRVPSVLGIGCHPSELVPDPSAIHYSQPVQDEEGALYWKTVVTAITVYVNGQPMDIQLTSASSQSSSPTAILDSGTPIILASTAIANGIYGAIGVSPGGDGQYYVPCTTPLNMTIQLDDRPDLPLHPLDMTYPSPSNPSSSTCMGIIQTFASIGQSEDNLDTDIILGVPFLRNTYTVMAYEAPDIDGSFAPPSTSGGPTGALATPDIDPRLGLMNLTDPTVAMQEFIQVRVNNQPLSPGSSSPQNSVTSSSSSDSSHHLPIGVDVLLALVGFLIFCFSLFGVRWLYMRNRLRKANPGRSPFVDVKHQDAYTLEALAHHLSTRADFATAYSLASGEDTLSTVRYGHTKSHPESLDSSSDREFGSRTDVLTLKRFSSLPSMTPSKSEFDESTLVAIRAPSPTLTRTPSPSRSSHHRVSSGEPGITSPLLPDTQSSSPREDITDADLDDAHQVGITGAGPARRASNSLSLFDTAKMGPHSRTPSS